MSTKVLYKYNIMIEFVFDLLIIHNAFIKCNFVEICNICIEFIHLIKLLYDIIYKHIHTQTYSHAPNYYLHYNQHILY